jgi:hypothetical protein
MQRTIDIHISKLLFHHECVVVPSFGAFITRQYAAEVNPSTHMFRPAGKRLSFNARINQNDGLLASQISKAEGITYNEAIESITISVRGWKRMLRSGKKIHLPRVGRLYMDSEGRLQFSPSLEVNYDMQSFGLSIFRAPSVQREAAIEQGINRVIETHKKAKSKGFAYSPMLRWAAILAPLIGLGIYAATTFTPTQVGLGDFSSLIPFVNDSSPKTEIQAVEPHTLPELELQAAPFEIEDAQDELPETAEPVAKKVAPTKTVVRSSQKHFHIVVGSFKEEENAMEYVRLLQRDHQVQAYIARGSENFYRVAIEGFSTRGKADKALPQIKAQINSAAWVYRN